MPFPVFAAMALGGAALGAIGTIQEGNARASSARLQADIDAKNAQLKLQLGTRAEGGVRRAGDRFIGKTEAKIGKSGVVRSGSVLENIKASMQEIELKALDARFKGVSEAQGLMTQAAIGRASAVNIVRAARLSAASQLLSGAAKAGSLAGGTPTPSGGSDFTFANNDGSASFGNF